MRRLIAQASALVDLATAPSEDVGKDVSEIAVLLFGKLAKKHQKK